MDDIQSTPPDTKSSLVLKQNGLKIKYLTLWSKVNATVLYATLQHVLSLGQVCIRRRKGRRTRGSLEPGISLY